LPDVGPPLVNIHHRTGQTVADVASAANGDLVHPGAVATALAREPSVATSRFLEWSQNDADY
jgi:hypothetical protein